MDLANLIFEERLREAEKWISENQPDLDCVNDQFNTPLLAAIDLCIPGFVAFLLERGADPNYLTKGVNLPLIQAIEIAVEEEDYSEDIDEARTDIIGLLIDHGADILKKDDFGRSPYDFAKNYHLSARKLFELLLLRRRRKGISGTKTQS